MVSKRVWLGLVAACVLVLVIGSGRGIGAGQGSGPEPLDAAAQAPAEVAAPPTQGMTIPYPGRLTDRSGEEVVDGLYDLSFALYAVETGGEPLWSEVQERVQVLRGELLTSLGAARPILASVLAGGGSLWLAVGVRGPGEAGFTALAPRQKLVSAAPKAAAASTSAACPHDHMGEEWIAGNQNDLKIEMASSSGTALYALSFYGMGVFGESVSYIGVLGDSSDYYGVAGISGSSYGV